MDFIFRIPLMASDGSLTLPTGCAVSVFAGRLRILSGLRLGLPLHICWDERCFGWVKKVKVKVALVQALRLFKAKRPIGGVEV